jgi:hypothetical protein
LGAEGRGFESLRPDQHNILIRPTKPAKLEHEGANSRGRCDRVGARGLVNGYQGGWLAIQPADHVVVLCPQLDTGDVLQSARCLRPNDDLTELFRGRKASGGARTVYMNCCPGGAGLPPISPAGFTLFWACIALMISGTVISRSPVYPDRPSSKHMARRLRRGQRCGFAYLAKSTFRACPCVRDSSELPVALPLAFSSPNTRGISDKGFTLMPLEVTTGSSSRSGVTHFLVPSRPCWKSLGRREARVSKRKSWSENEVIAILKSRSPFIYNRFRPYCESLRPTIPLTAPLMSWALLIPLGVIRVE